MKHAFRWEPSSLGTVLKLMAAVIIVIVIIIYINNLMIIIMIIVQQFNEHGLCNSQNEVAAPQLNGGEQFIITYF